MTKDEEVRSLTHGALRLRWDVFLSFRGEDTRHSFTKYLYQSLEDSGVRVFLDDVGLSRGDDIAHGLLSAIDDSAASIVVVSRRYSDSWWCLEELARISDLQRLILPVFFGVKPSDFRRQTGPFEEDLRRLERRFEAKKIERWRRAMKNVGALDGWYLDGECRDSKKLEAIRSLVKRVLIEVGKTQVGLSTYTVGLDRHVEELMRKLDLTSNCVKVLGLYGKNGVGKTTLAKNLYHKLADHFQYHSFLSATKYGLTSLQKKLITDLSPNNVHYPNELTPVINTIRWVVHEKRVLVVLDDVDAVRQLDLLIENREWFQDGSRIIVTMRDKEGVSFKKYVNEFYEVEELETSEAVQLFSFHALRRERPTNSSLSNSEEIVGLIGRLPLSLEVFGSFLYDKVMTKDWEFALQKLKKCRCRDLQDLIRMSVDGLDEEEKCIFLDISCLFAGMEMKVEDLMDVLSGCGFNSVIAIRDLISKALIKITEENTIWMHEQVREVGRQMVREENDNPAMRSRLWERDEIMSVFNNEGTEYVQGIVLDFGNESSMEHACGLTNSWKDIWRGLWFFPNQEEKMREFILRSSAFDRMSKLRLLQINHLKLERNFKSLPAELKWLQWRGCPVKALPSSCCPQELTVLDLSESTIQKVWNGFNSKVPEKLLVMNLRGCCKLAAIPDLTGHKNLKKLVLEGCIGLTKLHESIANLNSLIYLNLRGCSDLVELPRDVSGLKNLKKIVLSGCSKLRLLPISIGSMRSLTELFADETSILNLPESIFRLTKLEKLSLNSCKLLIELPEVIGKLCSLKELSLNGSAIKELPDSVGSLRNLEKLSLMWCESLSVIPDSIGNLKSLTGFSTIGCSIKELPTPIGSLWYLKYLLVGQSNFPDSIGGLASLVELQLDKTITTELPDQIGDLKLLRKLEMRKCKSLISLPLSIGSISALTTLIIDEACIIELPESIGNLEHLVTLGLNRCRQLDKLPMSIKKLKSLQHLLMEETAVTELPEHFGMLSSLKRLNMAKWPNTDRAQHLGTKRNLNFVFPASFSRLLSLNELNLCACNLSGEIPDSLEKLILLKVLDLSHNTFKTLPSSLRSLSILKRLMLSHCKELKFLPPLPSSLLELNIAYCISLESISDLSDLRFLQELNLNSCEKVTDIPGLECLKSLRRLYMSGCNSVLKKILSKVYLRNLYKLCMPGRRIPSWFSEKMVMFSDSKHRELKGIILCVVVSLSLNHQILDSFSDHLLDKVEIEVMIHRQSKEIHTETLSSSGLVKKDEDQLHMYLFPSCHPLVSKLKDGYRILVKMKKPALIDGVKLKQCGFDLIFESDDVFGEEGKLANVFKMFEGDESK